MKDYKEINGRFLTIEEISGGANLAVHVVEEVFEVRNSIYNSESLDNNMERNDIKLHAEMIKSKYSKSFDLEIEDRILLWDAIHKIPTFQKKYLYQTL